ncbi:uncharacterized protein NKAPD1-like [Mytilus californianus]|uniref:uncharacterized protein NKAPD1-like n=1 Tax=Mytilus californianus TaxID=6549 RepID=UPI0022476E08|nr:uncharacterized protein NKAPD1-like [Mytilus californianus]
MTNSAAKTLLKNYIRHVGSHNKIVEEAEMWKEHHRSKEFEKDNKYSFLQDKRVDMNDDFSRRKSKRAHMDEEPESTFCLRQLYKAEDNDPDRWGHSGYKEMYPKDFDSDRSEEEKSHRKPKKTKKKGKHKRKEKRKKSKKHYTSDSESESKRKRSKKHKKHSKRKKTKGSDYSSDSESDDKSNKLKDSDNSSRKRKHSENHGLKNDKYDNHSESHSKRTKHKQSKKHLSVNKYSHKKHKKKSHESSGSEFSDSESRQNIKRKKRKTDCDLYDNNCSSELRAVERFRRDSLSDRKFEKSVSESPDDRQIYKESSVGRKHRKRYRSYSGSESSDSD